MRLNFTILFAVLSLSLKAQDLIYPHSLKRPVTVEHHGYSFIDPYQWMEDSHQPELSIWIQEQNDLTLKYLKKLANKTNSINLMNRYMGHNTRWNTTQNINVYNDRESNYRLFYTDGFLTPSIYYKAHSYNRYSLLVDPRSISKEDNIFFQGLYPSADDQYLAYSFSRNGSDWREVGIISTNGTNSPKETLEDIKFSHLNWKGNGFFYKKYEHNDGKNFDYKDFPNLDDASVLLHPELHYHKLNTYQEQDSLVFKTNNPKDDLFLYSSSNEQMYLLEITYSEKEQYSYLYYDPNSSIPGFRPLFYKVGYELDFIEFIDGHFVMRATINDKVRIISFKPEAPNKMKVISPDFGNSQLTHYEIVENHLVLTYQYLSEPHMAAIDLEGNILAEVKLPSGVSVSNMFYQKASGEFFFILQSYIIPPVFCKLDLTNYEYKVVEQTEVSFEYQQYKYDIKNIPSTDGASVPVMLIYKGESPEKKPLLMKTYSGFGVINTPVFDPSVIYFIEQGGIFAYVFGRGGGELGYDWWQQGRLENKQHTIDDVISTAEYLSKEGIANRKKIGILGGSHGGLIAAAATIQRPDLFSASIINAGILDMLSYEKFTVGPKWEDEFGSVSDSLEFLNLAKYSPYQGISQKKSYPPMLIMTGTGDDRVPPIHSYKFAAMLQNLTNQTNPILLWSQADKGHLSNSEPIQDKLERNAYQAAFLHTFLLEDK